MQLPQLLRQEPLTGFWGAGRCSRAKASREDTLSVAFPTSNEGSVHLEARGTHAPSAACPRTCSRYIFYAVSPPSWKTCSEVLTVFTHLHPSIGILVVSCFYLGFNYLFVKRGCPSYFSAAVSMIKTAHQRKHNWGLAYSFIQLQRQGQGRSRCDVGAVA